MRNTLRLTGLGLVGLLAACAQDPMPRGPQMAATPPAPMMAPSPPPAPAPAPMPRGDGRSATLNFDGDTLTQANQEQLSPVVERLMANRRSRVTIATHAGREDRAMARSRAQAVRQALIDAGVPANRIRTVNATARGMSPNEVMVQVR
ncbi:MAG: OmpA family protein [Acetobacteraceae bacterium]|nr:OmpA family protein [Acetobacteraceae bacterium]